MGFPSDEEDGEEEEKKEEKKVRPVIDEDVIPLTQEEVIPKIDIPITQIELTPDIDWNIAPPLDFFPERGMGDSPTQSEVPLTESMVTAPPVPIRTKPRDKTLVKAAELLGTARRFVAEYKYEAAMQKLNERINLLKDPKYKLELAQSYLYAGHVLNMIRKNDEAKLLLEEGIGALKESRGNNPVLMANLKLELGIANQRLAKYEDALTLLHESGILYKNNGNHSGYIRTLWNKGILFYNTKDWQKAVETYLEIAQASSERPTQISTRLKSLQRIADLIQMVGKLGEADFDANPYLKEIHDMKEDYTKSLAQEIRRATKTGELIRIKSQEVHDPANLALWHFNLAAAEMTAPTGSMDSALENYNKAIELYTKIGDKLGLSRCYQHLALVKERQDKPKEAIALLRKSIELREDLKETMTLEEYRTTIQAGTIPLYDLLSYLEAKLHNYSASLNAIEQSKSRELINHLADEKLDTCPYVKNLLEKEEKTLQKLRELEQQLYRFGMRYSEVVRSGGETPPMEQDREKLEAEISGLHDNLQEYRRNIWMKCVDTGNVKPPIQYDILSQVMDVFRQERNWAMLEFIWNPAKTTLMVYLVTSEGIKLFQRTITAKELAAVLDNYKEALITEDITQLEKAAREISSKIIPADLFSALETLETIQYLFIIPHKELHAIPFEIIIHKSQYWGQKYCIVKNFSLDLCRITLQKRNEFIKSPPKIKNSAIVIGNPTLDLPMAEIEAQEAARMLKGKGIKVKLMLAKKSKEDDFKNAVKDYNIIHYAGHGIFITPEPILSHLSFTSSDLTAREIAQLKLKNSPIVILSACETAISDWIGGNEVVGFVRSFILAGATTIVTTNWPVHDESAQELVCKFYEFLLLGAPVGIALQKARQFIAQKYHNQIIHWAAYTLFGDPFRKL
ncbi:MAG: CHAT domain-containing protein [Candidatus Helarchaeota archaeon]